MSNPKTGDGALNFLRLDLQRHQVEVKLPNRQNPQDSMEEMTRDYYLIVMRGQTKLAEEFMATYPQETGMINLAIRIFGAEETICDYGVLLNDDLQIVFAFNRLFADYDHEKQEIVFKTAEQVLIEQLDQNNNLPPIPELPPESSPLPRQLRRRPFFPPSTPDGIMTFYGAFSDWPGGSGTAMIKYGAFTKKNTNTEPSVPAE
ncbi:MAG: hypothetical protein WC473_00225 [Patescibacteria group bacterium]|jgi:hypothetical protein